jgi:hypothetical protein
MRHSMCMKTRKSCQYCRYSYDKENNYAQHHLILSFSFHRYMKCLAVGMNPNYVLSEDERRRRFRKRNDSVNEKEKTNCVPVIRLLSVESAVGNF